MPRTAAIEISTQASNTSRHRNGAWRSSMKCSSTKRTLKAAIIKIDTAVTTGETASLDSHQVVAQVASISTSQTRLTGFDKISIRYRSR
jgi:hypothetical protein